MTRQTYNFVTVDVTDSIATVVIDKPPANAFNPSLIAELLDLLPTLASDQSVRAIVITGTGRFFVAGADITVMR
ncbi:enoyl-CoA hydratase-related protein, partial [Streptomyces albus]